MYIKIGCKDIELSTKLGTAMMLEKRFKLGLRGVFDHLGDAITEELVDIISIAAQQANKEADIKADIIEHYDYLDLFDTVQNLIVHIMFSGDEVSTENKMEKFQFNEDQKKQMREMLGIQTAPKAQ